MLSNTQLSSLFCFCLALFVPSNIALPHSIEENIMVEEIKQLSGINGRENNVTATLMKLSELKSSDDNIGGQDNDSQDSAPLRQQIVTVDNLVYMEKNTKNRLHEQEEKSNHEIDLLTRDKEDSISAGSSSAEYKTEQEEDDGNIALGVIEPVDMSDFLTLIPIAEVKLIAAKYYQNDAEVQRAYSFLSSRYFNDMRVQLVQQPEIKSFLRYLNNSGLNVLSFLQTVTNITRNLPDLSRQPGVEQIQQQPIMTNSSVDYEIEDCLADATTHLHKVIITETTTAKTIVENQQLKGLHGLVDSILRILPQDEILATFFDKLETNEKFSNLVDRIGNPKFASILQKLQNSVPFKNLISTLHNNGIYVTRIIESLKLYFFLGTL